MKIVSHRLFLSVSVKYLIEMPTLLPQFLMKLERKERERDRERGGKERERREGERERERERGQCLRLTYNRCTSLT